jgi:hypothetical protein
VVLALFSDDGQQPVDFVLMADEVCRCCGALYFV